VCACVLQSHFLLELSVFGCTDVVDDAAARFVCSPFLLLIYHYCFHHRLRIGIGVSVITSVVVQYPSQYVRWEKGKEEGTSDPYVKDRLG